MIDVHKTNMLAADRQLFSLFSFLVVAFFDNYAQEFVMHDIIGFKKFNGQTKKKIVYHLLTYLFVLFTPVIHH